ncbi:hypothetical protein LshimejAT787_1000250 [Lyophyllum shimeji]|uniref:F-box domain-containing protein n=1 Tax=Lyophyllum shimeji TaxID=47721 RepID=A0A9P3URK0_LYOSH|nr:hypothetical protein LshimejAT787_1000250 [Lyophyllum shimeji]
MERIRRHALLTQPPFASLRRVRIDLRSDSIAAEKVFWMIVEKKKLHDIVAYPAHFAVWTNFRPTQKLMAYAYIELVNEIIDHLHDDDLTLKACALVCRAWLPASRSRIFHHITLEGKPGVSALKFPIWRGKTRHIRRLYAILSSTPEIVPCVRTAVIREGMVGREWMVREKTLVPILRMLNNVERFELERAAAMELAWAELPLELKGAVQHLLALPSLREVKLGMLALDDPKELLRILEGCRNLRLLHLYHLRLRGPMSYESIVEKDIPPARVDALIVGPRTSPEVVGCLLHPQFNMDMSSLRRLSLSISGNFAEYARLVSSAVALENLEIIFMSDVDLAAYQALPSSDRFDMSHNPYLRRLAVKFDVIQRQDDPLPWLNALFATFTTPNILEYIHIVYSLYLPEPYMDRSANTTIFDGWQAIDATLARPVLQSLRQVKLEFSLENPIGYGVAPRFLEEVDLKSPRLRARNVLVVEAFDTSG